MNRVVSDRLRQFGEVMTFLNVAENYFTNRLSFVSRDHAPTRDESMKYATITLAADYVASMEKSSDNTDKIFGQFVGERIAQLIIDHGKHRRRTA